MAAPSPRAATSSLARPKYFTGPRAPHMPGSALTSTHTTRRATPERARHHAASHHKLFSTQTSTCATTFAPQTSAPPPPPAPAIKQFDSRRLEPARHCAPARDLAYMAVALLLLACCCLHTAHSKHTHTHTTASRRERPPPSGVKDKMTIPDLKDITRPQRHTKTLTTYTDLKDITQTKGPTDQPSPSHSPNILPHPCITAKLKNKNELRLRINTQRKHHTCTSELEIARDTHVFTRARAYRPEEALPRRKRRNRCVGHKSPNRAKEGTGEDANRKAPKIENGLSEAEEWERDLNAEGIEPHPGPR